MQLSTGPQVPRASNRRALAVATVAAAVGSVLLWLYLDRFEQQASGGPRVGVLMALESIERGETLTDDKLAMREVPLAYVEERFVKEFERDKVIGLRLKNELGAQQTLMWTDLAITSDEPRDLSELIPKGRRAVSVRASAGDTGFSFIRPGDYVDVIANLPGSDGGARAAIVLLQRILVLAVGLETAGHGRDEEPARKLGHEATVTLSVSLRQAQLLALAVEQGNLQVALRNPEDQRVASEISDVSSAALAEPAARAAVQRNSTGPIRLHAGGS